MADSVKPARVRFAPSPTGHLHLGGARVALFDYLLAHQTGGQFILRIEDTDRKRFVPGAEEELMAGLRWLGLQWDEGPDVGGPFGPYRQSERKEIYQHYAHQLIEQGQAFYCFCTPERLDKVRQEQLKNKEDPHYDGACRGLDPDEAARRVASGEKFVIRFKTPKTGTTTAVDVVRGPITVENRRLDDYILVKSDGLALYHLAAMVDDHLMGITHVFRGSEWLPTFPLHVQVVRAFGWEEPAWVHLSVFLKPSGKGKMSKRESADLIKDGYSIFVKDLEQLGYLPEAVINWITLMGWSYDDHTEFFTLPDLTQKFNLDHLNPSPAAINFTKLDYFNGLHIRSLADADLARRVKPFLTQAGYTQAGSPQAGSPQAGSPQAGYPQAGSPADDDRLLKVAPLIKERIATLDEAVDMAGFFFKDLVNPAPEELVAKGLTAAESAGVAKRAYAVLAALPELSVDQAEPPMRALVEELGLTPGQVFGILRVAVTGQKVSPPLFESMAVIGRLKVLERLKKAIALLEEI